MVHQQASIGFIHNQNMWGWLTRSQRLRSPDCGVPTSPQLIYLYNIVELPFAITPQTRQINISYALMHIRI